MVFENYGGMVSGADYFIYQYAKEQGLNIKAVYVLKMPENVTIMLRYRNHTSTAL